MNRAPNQNPPRRPPPLTGSIVARLVAWVTECGLWILWCWNRGKIEGELPSGPVVVVANHGSYLDWLLLSIVTRRKFGRHIRFLAKPKVAQNPWFRLLLDASAAIVLNDGHNGCAIVTALRALQGNDHINNHTLGIFPEGTRSRIGMRLPCSEGAAALARRANATLVPVALCGFWEVWPPQKRLPVLRRKCLSVHFLEPIHPNGDSDNIALVHQVMDRAYEVVERERGRKNGTVV